MTTYFWGKVGYMRFLFLECGEWHKHWEVTVLDAQFLDLGVEEPLDDLPDGVGPGPQDVAAADVVVLDELGLGDDLCVPVGQHLILPRLQA